MSPDTTVPQRLGNYEIVSKIAEGGMGTVYKARNRLTGDIVAVKVIAKETTKSPILLQRFEREFLAAKVLDHPNVVKAIEYCGTLPNPFLVMEFVDGESLGQRMERLGAYPEAEAVRIVAQVCEGLQRAHKQGLVHRDVKPDNILVTREGVAKLTDMGLVKDVDGDLNLTKTGRGLGTPHYMAPEQFRNAKTVDVRGDIYSLGATLYAMVTGRIPFENASPLDCWMKKIRNEFPPPRELNPSVSDRVDWAIRRAMSAEPDRRPASCREFLEDLTGQSRTTPTSAKPVPGAVPVSDVWYMVYKDETGAAHTVKGSTEGIRKALGEHLLGDAGTILVSRTKGGRFQSLGSVAEFRDLVVNPAPMASPGGQRGAAGSGVVAKPSGVVPQSGVAGRVRRVAEGAAVELGADPAGGSGASANPPRTTGPASDQDDTASPARSTPTSNGPSRRTPAPIPMPTALPVDPLAETQPYDPNEFPPDTSEPREADATRRPAKKSKKPEPFDWTPILVILVMILSALVGYLVLTN